MKYAFLGLATLMTLIQPASANVPTQALLKDMVSLDQIYIPALAFTSQQKPNPARKAIFLLQAQWEAFGFRYADLARNDPQWQTGFARVSEAIQTAERHIRTAQWQKAHEALEPIRGIFKDLRAQRGLDYFIDGLTAFHEVMESIVKFAQDTDTLTPDDYRRLQALHARADALWNHVEMRPFDAGLFGFGAQKTYALKQHIAQERDALTALDAALGQGDVKTILRAAKQIKAPFAKTFMLFGDFKSVQ